MYMYGFMFTVCQLYFVIFLRLSTIKKFPPDKMDSLRNLIVEDPKYFLLLSSTKQAILVDKIVQRLVNIIILRSRRDVFIS